MIRFTLAAVMAVPVAVACGFAAAQTIPATLQLDIPRLEGAATSHGAATASSRSPAGIASTPARRDLSTVIHDGDVYDAAHQIETLQAVVRDLQSIRGGGGFTSVPAGAALRIGDIGAGVAALDRRLRESGELTEPRAEPEIFDAVLESAAKRFQSTHGLETDGVIGERTLAMLNESVDALISRVELNIARLGQAGPVPFGRHIIVNIPGFELTAYRDARPVLTMPVVVGRRSRQTPELAGPVTHLVVNPTWTVPSGILRRDVAPRMLEDSSYMSRNSMRNLSGGSVDWAAVARGASHVRLRQSPGPGNPLGRFRFQLLNDQSIFLHDTNHPELFARDRRSYSSGCIRVGDPWTLAEFVAEGIDEPWREWGEDRRWRTRWIELPQHIPVTIEYRTIWVDRSGTLQVREDVYGRDRRDLLALSPSSEPTG